MVIMCLQNSAKHFKRKQQRAETVLVLWCNKICWLAFSRKLLKGFGVCDRVLLEEHSAAKFFQLRNMYINRLSLTLSTIRID